MAKHKIVALLFNSFLEVPVGNDELTHTVL